LPVTLAEVRARVQRRRARDNPADQSIGHAAPSGSNRRGRGLSASVPVPGQRAPGTVRPARLSLARRRSGVYLPQDETGFRHGRPRPPALAVLRRHADGPGAPI